MITLFKDGLVYPLNGNDNHYKYLLIKNDKIIYIGNDYPSIKIDKEISLKDQFIYPSFIDSHLHLLYSIVSSASSFNICSITKDGIYPNSINDVKDEIIKYVNNHNKDKLIIINQYITPAIKEQRLPTCNELDSWCNNKDVVVFCIDGHSASLSSSLLKKLNISSENGILSGASYDMNQGVITGYVASSVTLKTLLKGIVNFTNNCNRYGISTICALDGEVNNKMLFNLLVFIARRLDINVLLYPQYHDYKILDKLKHKMKNKRIGGCSSFELDGSVGSLSASFYHPYIINNKQADLYYEDTYIDSKVKEALENNISFTCHAIGSKAIDQIVNAYKNNIDLLDKSDIYNRIDHFEFPCVNAIDFISNHKIAITIQPGYSYIDKYYIHSYENHLSKDDLDLLLPLKKIEEKGILMLGSSDSPVQSINPFDQMFGMVNYYNDAESLSNYEALKTYTTNPSIAINEDDGRLIVNKKANFIITSKDILTTNKNEISQISIDSFYRNGKKVKDKKANLSYLLSFIFKKPKKI